MHAFSAGVSLTLSVSVLAIPFGNSGLPGPSRFDFGIK